MSTYVWQFLSAAVFLIVLTSDSVHSAPSYGALIDEMNPVMRQYKFLTTMGNPFVGSVPGRKMRSTMRARNCFFSPVTCQLSRVPPQDSTGGMRRRRRLLSSVEENSAEYPVGGLRYRRNGPGWNGGLYL